MFIIPPQAKGGGKMTRARYISSSIALYLLWSFFVLYPNPAMFFSSIPRAISPPIDEQAVADMASKLPDDPAAIESAVNSYIRYEVPWQTYNVPWYFPTVSEALANRAGDCQARMIVFASILEYKDMPYKLRYSLDHAWVEYPRKKPNLLEKRSLSVMVSDGKSMKLSIPKQVQWKETYRIRKQLWWDYMPMEKRILMLLGLPVVVFRRKIYALFGRASRAFISMPRWVKITNRL